MCMKAKIRADFLRRASAGRNRAQYFRVAAAAHFIYNKRKTIPGKGRFHDSERRAKRLGIFAYFDADDIVDDYVAYLVSETGKYCARQVCIVNGTLTPGE